jgi:predicted nuclease with TOPRIM domain|tara:strand:- start:1076 stop:1366 length:291 start_codon:yes stop_codon:yes gene_type:complete
MGFNRSQIDAEFEKLLGEDTFGDQFDFGFADEVEVSEVTGASEETKETLDHLEKLILPILYNLKKNPEKDYIVWDGAKRAAACEEQIQRILEITRK